MKILGIDPGSALCGWAIIEADNNNQKLVESGCIKTPSTLPLIKGEKMGVGDVTARRLKIIHDELSTIIKKHKPAEAAVEELFFVKNIKTGIAVGQARGVILLTLAINGIKIAEYKPTQIKMALTGYGHADKKQIMSMVRCVLGRGVTINQDDEADAVAVAICHINHANMRARMTREYVHTNSKVANDTLINHSNRESRITREYTHANDTPSSYSNQTSPIARESSDVNNLVYPKLSYKVIGVLQKVSNEIGFVLNERYYYPFIEDELRNNNINFIKQVPLNISIEGIRGRYFFDYLIDDKIVLEIKIGSRFSKKDVDQVMAYLRATGKKLGILARFTRSGVLTKRFLLGKNNVISV